MPMIKQLSHHLSASDVWQKIRCTGWQQKRQPASALSTGNLLLTWLTPRTRTLDWTFGCPKHPNPFSWLGPIVCPSFTSICKVGIFSLHGFNCREKELPDKEVENQALLKVMIYKHCAWATLTYLLCMWINYIVCQVLYCSLFCNCNMENAILYRFWVFVKFFKITVTETVTEKLERW